MELEQLNVNVNKMTSSDAKPVVVDGIELHDAGEALSDTPEGSVDVEDQHLPSMSSVAQGEGSQGSQSQSQPSLPAGITDFFQV